MQSLCRTPLKQSQKPKHTYWQIATVMSKKEER